MENLVDRTAEKLKDSTAPGNVLCELWIALFRAKPNQALYQQFRRLNEVYGRHRVFFAIIRIADSYFGKTEEITIDSPYALVAHIANAEFKETYKREAFSQYEDLSKYVEAYKEKVNGTE